MMNRLEAPHGVLSRFFRAPPVFADAVGCARGQVARGGVTMWTAKLMHMFIHEYAEQNLAKKKLTRRIFIGGGLGALVIVGSGAGWAYNRYLAEHTEIEDTTAYEAAAAQANASASGSATADPTELTGVKINGQSLTANKGSITITSNTTGSGSDAVVSFVADIKLNNATLLRSAFANNKFGQNIIDTPSNIVSEHHGIWAINGDYYGFRTTGIADTRFFPVALVGRVGVAVVAVTGNGGLGDEIVAGHDVSIQVEVLDDAGVNHSNGHAGTLGGLPRFGCSQTPGTVQVPLLRVESIAPGGDLGACGAYPVDTAGVQCAVGVGDDEAVESCLLLCGAEGGDGGVCLGTLGAVSLGGCHEGCGGAQGCDECCGGAQAQRGAVRGEW